MASTTPQGGNAEDKRAAQRERLRKEREKELKRQRKTRNAIIAVVSIVALLLAAGAAWLLYDAFKPEPELPLNQPASVSSDAPYLIAGAEPGSGKPEVDIVFDFMCPFCGDFERTNGQDISSLVENKEATVNFYVRSFLSEHGSTTEYSARAAGAAVCTYEESPETFVKFQSLMFEDQPQEGGPGLTDAQIADKAKAAGASADTVDCITSHTYQRWAVENLEPAGAKLAPSTPFVRINGEEWGSDGAWQTPGTFAQAVRAADPADSADSAASDSGN